MKKVYLATENPEKLQIARKACEGFPVFVEAESSLNIPEIQSDDIEEIARTSAVFAAQLNGHPIIKIDSGLFIEALNGIPGPYSAHFEKRMDARFILKMMEGQEVRAAYYRDVLAYAEPNGVVRTWSNRTLGNISTEIQGSHGMNFDRIFVRSGDSQAMAMFPDSERLPRYSRDHWKGFLDFLMTTSSESRITFSALE